VAIDSVEADIAPLEEVQLYFLRRLLRVNDHSMRAFLFTETGVMPIRHRRMVLALRALKYYVSSPPNSFPRLAVDQSIALAGAGHTSWAGLLLKALERLLKDQRPTTCGVVSFFSIQEIDALIDRVAASAWQGVASEILQSPRVPLLHHRAQTIMAIASRALIERPLCDSCC